MFLNVLFMEGECKNDACEVLEKLPIRDTNVESLNSGLNGRNAELESVEQMYLDTLFMENVGETSQIYALKDPYLGEFFLKIKNDLDTIEMDYSNVIRGSVTSFPIENILPNSSKGSFSLHTQSQLYAHVAARDNRPTTVHVFKYILFQLESG